MNGFLRREPRQVYRVYDEDDFLADVEPEHGAPGLDRFSETEPSATEPHEPTSRAASAAPRVRFAPRLLARWAAAGLGGLLIGTLAVAGFRTIANFGAKRA